MEPIDNVLARLKATPSGKNQWNATCPCRSDDDNPSLRVSVGKHNQVLMNCLRGGGCDLQQICTAIDLSVSDLFPKDETTTKKTKLTLVDTYPYYNERGELVMEVLRFTDNNGKKTFRQRQPNPDGGWNWSTSDIQKPLYRLPQILKAKEENRPIYIVEGEKDVHSLETLGKTATTNPGGAGAEGQNKWTSHHTQTLAGANIIIITDNDEPGYAHAEHVHNELTKAGCKVKMFKPGTYKDITELIENNETLNETLIPYNDTNPQPTNQTNPLTNLIRNLQQLNPNTPQQTLTNKIQSHVDNYYTETTNQTLDTGRLVQWTPFLEEKTDLTYDWIIPDLLERHERVIVVASEGGGKTTLARQIALMTAAGIHPFHKTPMKPARTLMIDLENPERIIKRASTNIYNQIKNLNKHQNMDAHLLMKPDGINLLTPTDKTIIENHVAEIQPDILFIGPLYKAYIDPGHRTAEAISTEIARYLDHLRTTYNCALWIEHHAPLGSGGHRDLRPFGSAVWSRWSEFGIALTPDPTDPELIEFKHYRGQREQRQWPTICKKGGTWPFEAIEYNQPNQPTTTHPQNENEEF